MAKGRWYYCTITAELFVVSRFLATCQIFHRGTLRRCVGTKPWLKATRTPPHTKSPYPPPLHGRRPIHIAAAPLDISSSSTSTSSASSPTAVASRRPRRPCSDDGRRRRTTTTVDPTTVEVEGNLTLPFLACREPNCQHWAL